MPLSVSSSQLSIIKNTLYPYRDKYRFLFFGSRTNNNHKKFSDLDLCIKAKNHTTSVSHDIIKIQSDFEDSNLPFIVDIIEYKKITPEFKKIIEKNFYEITFNN